MTVAALTPSIEYLEDGVTLAFAAPFRFLSAAHLAVGRVADDESVTLLVRGVHWNASGGGTDAGGTVTLVSSSAGARLRIARATPRAQAMDYTTGDTFPAESHEGAVDRAMLIDQEQDAALGRTDTRLTDTTNRALLVPRGEVAAVLPALAERAGKVLGFDASGAPIDVTLNNSLDGSLRADLAGAGAGEGAALLGWAPGGGYGAGSAGFKLLQMPVRLEDFGNCSTPAGTAAALTACNAFRAATGVGLLIDKAYALPTSGGPYDLGPAPIHTGPAASVSGNVYMGGEREFAGRLPVSFDNGSVHFQTVLGADWGRKFEQRERALDGGAIDDRLRIEALDMTTLVTSRWPSDASDVWTAEVPATVTASSLTYNLTADANWHTAWVPVQGGQEVSAMMKGASATCFRGGFIDTTAGREYFYAPDNFPGTFAIKEPGLAPGVVSPVGWLGQSDHQSYQAQHSEWTIRAVQSRKYALLLNGTEIFPARDLTVNGEIIGVGFGLFGGGVSSIDIKYACRVTRREQTGKAPLHVGIVGNSISDAAVHGSWDKWMREALDAANGVKLLSVTNLAVSGYNSYQIATSIGGGALGPANVCVIVAPEVNDVQTGASVATTVGNIASLIATLKASGVVPVLCLGYLWYSQVLAYFQGQATTNYEAGAEHRAALRHLAASTDGVYLVDFQQMTGPMIATYLAAPSVTDPMVRDNIHPTSYLYRLLGSWVAKAILRATCPPMTPKVKRAALPMAAGYGWLRNGWGHTNGAYSLTDEGVFRLHGLWTAGTKVDGTVIAQLPAAYAPGATEECSVSTDAGHAVLQVSAAGNVAIYNMGAATFLRLGNISWITALSQPAGSGGCKTA